MHHAFYRSAAAATLVIGGAANAVFAAAPVPPPPVAPAASSVLFRDEVAGRRLLLAARDVYRAAPAVRFSATWSAGQSAGTETLAAEPSALRLALTTTTKTLGGTLTRRAVASGDALVATRVVIAAKRSPAREFVRLPLAPGDTLDRALAAVQVAPQTRAAALLLDPRATVSGRAWRVATTQKGADSVRESVPAPSPDRPRLERHYLLDGKTHRLLRFEEWSVVDAPRRGRAAAEIVYRREMYTNAPLAERLPATLWAQTLPSSYQEKALPAVDLPPAGEPPIVDAQARRLLTRWKAAQERFLSYQADVEVTLRRGATTAGGSSRGRDRDNRYENARVLYTATIRKPDQARLTQDTTDVPEQWERSYLVVADGRSVSVLDRKREQTRTQTTRGVSDLPDLGQAVRRAGFNDWAGALDWLFQGEPDYDRAVYKGRETLENEVVDVIELSEETERRERGDRPADTVTFFTVFLGASDGLPRKTERRRETRISGLFERDQPVDQIITARFRRTSVDAEPPARAFVFNPPADATERRGGGGRRGG